MTVYCSVCYSSLNSQFVHLDEKQTTNDCLMVRKNQGDGPSVRVILIRIPTCESADNGPPILILCSLFQFYSAESTSWSLMMWDLKMREITPLSLMDMLFHFLLNSTSWVSAGRDVWEAEDSPLMQSPWDTHDHHSYSPCAKKWLSGWMSCIYGIHPETYQNMSLIFLNYFYNHISSQHGAWVHYVRLLEKFLYANICFVCFSCSNCKDCCSVCQTKLEFLWAEKDLCHKFMRG